MTDTLTSEPSEPATQAGLPFWSDFHGLTASKPFVYISAWEAPSADSTPGMSGYPPAHAVVADTVQQLFDSWITILASWAQAGTATICQRGDQIETMALAANGDPLMRDGWS